MGEPPRIPRERLFAYNTPIISLWTLERIQKSVELLDREGDRTLRPFAKGGSILKVPMAASLGSRLFQVDAWCWHSTRCDPSTSLNCARAYNAMD